MATPTRSLLQSVEYEYFSEDLRDPDHIGGIVTFRDVDDGSSRTFAFIGYATSTLVGQVADFMLKHWIDGQGIDPPYLQTACQKTAELLPHMNRELRWLRSQEVEAVRTDLFWPAGRRAQVQILGQPRHRRGGQLG